MELWLKWVRIRRRTFYDDRNKFPSKVELDTHGRRAPYFEMAKKEPFSKFGSFQHKCSGVPKLLRVFQIRLPRQQLWQSLSLWQNTPLYGFSLIFFGPVHWVSFPFFCPDPFFTFPLGTFFTSYYLPLCTPEITINEKKSFPFLDFNISYLCILIKYFPPAKATEVNYAFLLN